MMRHPHALHGRLIPAVAGRNRGEVELVRERGEARAVVLDDHVEAVSADDVRHGHMAIVVCVCVADDVATRLRHGELQVGDGLRVDGEGAREADEGQASEQQVLRLGGEREPDSGAGLGGHDASCASIRPRITASERRSSRDTCICEMPSSAAICAWVISR